MRHFEGAGSLALLFALPLAVACAPKVSAGEWQCSADGEGSEGGASNPPLETDPVALPWSTGFEERFCDYTEIANYCYGDAPYTVVQEPRHGGRFAAEFKVSSAGMSQTRCVRGGVFPESAYYSAWYYLPMALTSVKSAWNLWHFQAGDDPDGLRDLWDVNLSSGPQAGTWELSVLDRAENFAVYRSDEPLSVPIGRWFQITLFLRRASDATGEIRLYQDRTLLFEQTKLKSDASKFTQWYVGDWAEGATPADSSLYVDDVSISATRSAAP